MSVTPVRPERTGAPISPDAFGVVEQPLTLRERAWNNGALRKTALLILLAVAWESYARAINNPLFIEEPELVAPAPPQAEAQDGRDG